MSPVANSRIEPDSLANLVTNLDVEKCANAQDAYLECTNYAITQLDLPNVSMYLDAGMLKFPITPLLRLC